MQADQGSHRIIPRRTALRWFLIIVPVCAVAIMLLLKFAQIYIGGLKDLAQENATLAAAKTLTAVQIALGSIVVFSVAVGVYVVWYGYRAIETGYFPPLGAWVLEGKPVHAGRKARTIAWLQIALGLLLVTVGGVAVYYAWVKLPGLLHQKSAGG